MKIAMHQSLRAVVLSAVLVLTARSAIADSTEVASMWIADAQELKATTAATRVALLDVLGVRPLTFHLIQRMEAVLQKAGHNLDSLAALATGDLVFAVFLGEPGRPHPCVLSLQVRGKEQSALQAAKTINRRSNDVHAVMQGGQLWISQHAPPGHKDDLQELRQRYQENRRDKSRVAWDVRLLEYLATCDQRPGWLDVIHILGSEGLDRISIHGTDLVKGGRRLHEVEIRTLRPRRQLLGAAAALRFLDGPLLPERWVPREFKGTYFSTRVDLQRVFRGLRSVTNRLLGAMPNEDLVGDVLEGYRRDQFGPQVDVERDIIAHLSGRMTVLTDWSQRGKPTDAQTLIAIHINNPQVVSRAVDKIMRYEYPASRREHVIRPPHNLTVWRYHQWVIDYEKADRELRIEGIIREEVDDEPEPEPWLRSVACVTTRKGEGVIFLSSSPQRLSEVLKQLHRRDSNKTILLGSLRYDHDLAAAKHLVYFSERGSRIGGIGRYGIPFPEATRSIRNKRHNPPFHSPVPISYSVFPQPNGWRIVADLGEVPSTDAAPAFRTTKGRYRPRSRPLLRCWWKRSEVRLFGN